MENSTLSKIIEAWQAREQNGSLEMLRPCVQSIQLLAQGQPVSTAQFRVGSQLSEAEIMNYLTRLKKCGGEFDENGNLIGNMLGPRQLKCAYLGNNSTTAASQKGAAMADFCSQIWGSSEIGGEP